MELYFEGMGAGRDAARDRSVKPFLFCDCQELCKWPTDRSWMGASGMDGESQEYQLQSN